MKKIINNPKNFVDETIEGILYAYSDKVKILNGDNRILLTNQPVADGKVGIVTGGGSGHLPVFLGYVGDGMLDGCAIGNVFASPSANKMTEMIKACNYGSGVLCLYGNYGGDNMNFDMACENADFEDIKTATIRVKDDIASNDDPDKRRGVAGMVYAFKIAGAAAKKMMSLEEIVRVTEKALANIRTMGVALSPCILPEVGNPTFFINDNDMEIGMGIHGEPGIDVKKMMTADEIAELIFKKFETELSFNKGDEVSVMINGLGATPMEEQLIVYRKLHLLLNEKGVTSYMPHIGEFATSMEMAGLSITIFKLDEELKELLRYPAMTPFYTNHNK